MGRYTESLEDKWYEICPEDDDYKEKLMEVTKMFRGFDQVLDEFLVNKGYPGAEGDVDQKAAFVKTCFEKTGIERVPRNLKKYFTENRRFDRTTAFQFCFAFELDIRETEDFFRRVCLQRGIDCHDMQEAVYYYAIRNGLSWTEAQGLIQRLPEDKKGKVDLSSGDILYTGTVVRALNQIRDEEGLIHFLKENQRQFGYNNATAYQLIMTIWNKIVEKKTGLADREMALFENGEKDNKKDKKKNTEEKPRSVWEIYLQILGLGTGIQKALSVSSADRSLKPLLKDSSLLHPLAEENFPDRQGLEMITSGKHVSYERVRKMLILLVFYYYWVSLAIKRVDGTYSAKYGDGERCIDQINRYLADASYPELYAGNPYDWIFMFAAQDDLPLATFREFMQEICREAGIRDM